LAGDVPLTVRWFNEKQRRCGYRVMPQSTCMARMNPGESTTHAPYSPAQVTRTTRPHKSREAIMNLQACRSFCLLLLLVANCCASDLHAQDAFYDLVLRHGRIVDGTGNPWFAGDVAIRGDRIVAIGLVERDRAKREIDATGLVIAPGFIDIHSHSDFLLLEDGNAESKIRQGVTTEVLGEGSSAGPFEGKLSPQQATVGGKLEQWSSLGEYLDLIERSGVATNVASYVGLNNAWQAVMGDSFDRPNDTQIQAMRELVERAMQDGAFGLSSQVMMPPGSLATTDEIVEIVKAVEPFGGIYSTHIRNEGTGVFESVKEAIEIGERAGVAVDVIHLKIADQQLWGRMNEVAALIEAARRRGVNVQA
ncbi:MAG: amidohydrolase family protein, partial [Planctomycetales bacterium]|nr:amidohydrolase family protein [Planctomycetales bacterium]